jgi:redox-sensitive bicupin YhaK (pirin superfamily)
MITLRRNIERHHLRHGTQEAQLTFYLQDQTTDPLAGGFGPLKSLDEIRLPPGTGAPPYTRLEVETVTYVLEGTLMQNDGKGCSDVIHTGEFQHIAAGRRIRYSEKNASQTDEAHIFRISLRPSEVEIDLACEQRLFSVAERRGVLCIVASPDGRKGSLRIHQDTLIYSAILDVGQHLVHELPPGRIAWLHVVCGEAILGDLLLATGDGVGIMGEPAISFTAQEQTEILLLDLGSPGYVILPVEHDLSLLRRKTGTCS